MLNRRTFLGITAGALGAALLPKRKRVIAGPRIPVAKMREAFQKAYNPPILTWTVVPWAGEEYPKGWIPCDGRELSPNHYAVLFSAIGEKVPKLGTGYIIKT